MCKRYLQLDPEEAVMVKKLAKKYSNPWLTITVRKNNRIPTGGHGICRFKPGNKYDVTIIGDHIANKVAFLKQIALYRSVSV